MIKVNQLSKSFKVHKKNPGLMASIKSLFKRDYLLKKAVDNLSFEVSPGEILGLIGSNGAGKTTLTKILSGIIHPDSGSVEVMGFIPWERKNAYRKQMSLIMGQKAQLWWDLPAMDGLLLLKEIYRISEIDFSERLSFLSKTLEIEKELTIQVRRLSLGERMKVELIAALIHNPKVVFLDEPTIGLDLKAQKSVRKFIKTYSEKYRPIMILTSHYMEDIEELCERVIIMKSGRFIYNGKLKELKSQYATSKTIDLVFKSKINRTDIEDKLEHVLRAQKLNDFEYRLLCKSHKALQVARDALLHFDIKDITLKEEPIGELVEKILKDKKL